MKTIRDVLVIGAGISGYAVALAVAKRGIPVTLVTSPLDQRIYHSSFIKMENLEEHLKNLKHTYKQIGCSRAIGQLMNLARTSIDELLGSHLHVDRYGNIDIYRCLQEQLKQIPHVEWITHHSAIELLTLENHSLRKSDVYKKSTCLGAYVYNYETKEVEEILAKETILASGGAASLFPYSTNVWSAKGSGLAMAYRAGARVVNMDQIQFHSLGLYGRDKPSIPLPIDLLMEGGRLYTSSNICLQDLPFDKDLSLYMYEELFKSKSNHLWLDLTMLDPLGIQEKYLSVDTWCLNYGFNMAKDLIPVSPIVQSTRGGVSVDPAGRTTVNRLRAIGEVACTGLFYDFKNEADGVLESLTWAFACAEDVAKQLLRFIYYFPELREWNRPTDLSFQPIKEDWYMMQQVMWHYVGIIRDEQRLKRGYALLQRLKAYNASEEEQAFSIDRMYLNNALDAAIMITQAALEKYKLQQKTLKYNDSHTLNFINF